MGPVTAGGEFLLNRTSLLDSIGNAANDAMSSYNRVKESSKLTEQVFSITVF